MKMSEQGLNATRRFAEMARRFCEWARHEPGDPLLEMETARKFLLNLHQAALELPDVEFEDSDEAGPKEDEASVRLSVEESRKKLEPVLERFGKLPLQTYWEVYNPLDADDHEAVCGWLADDLGDIYGDLSKSLALFDLGKLAAAAWEWRFDFENHWGQHLTDAQKALHWWFAERAL